MLKSVLRWVKSKLWMRRNLAMSRGTRIAMAAGQRMFEKKGGASPALIEAVRLALENDRQIRKLK